MISPIPSLADTDRELYGCLSNSQVFLPKTCQSNRCAERDSVGQARRLAVTAMCALALLAAPAAQASTITVGSVLPPGSVPTEFGQVRTLFNTALPEKGANLASPVKPSPRTCRSAPAT